MNIHAHGLVNYLTNILQLLKLAMAIILHRQMRNVHVISTETAAARIARRSACIHSFKTIFQLIKSYNTANRSFLREHEMQAIVYRVICVT